MTRSMRVAACLVIVLAGSGCSMKTLVADNMTGLLEEVEGNYLRETSYLYGKEAGPGLLKQLDGIIASSPNNEDLLATGCRMDAQYAQAFVEKLGSMTEEEEEYSRSLHLHALEYGLRALDDEDLEAAMKGSADGVRAILAEYDEDDVGLLFWTGMAFGGWINRNKDSMRAVADLPVAVAFMERVIELDESFFFGGAHLFLGQYYGSRGKDLGGDPEKAAAEFDKVLALTEGKSLLARVFKARYYAVPTQNEELFEQLLDEVLDAPLDILPGQELSSAVAKHKAEELYFEAEDFFVGAPAGERVALRDRDE